MIGNILKKLLRVDDAEQDKRVSSDDAMLNRMDDKVYNLDSYIQPLPESKPRTPFGSPNPNGEKRGAALMSVPQLLQMLPNMIPLMWNMQRGSNLYKSNFKPKRKVAEDHFVNTLESLAYELGVKDIKYIKIPRNAIFQDKGIPHEYGIVFTVEMDREPISTAPSFDALQEVMKGYKNISVIANKLAKYMRTEGFSAYPGTALGGTTDYVHLAEIAGLGAIGYHGLLISPTEGARLRIGVIYTNIENLPTQEDNEHLWVRDFCAMCKKCVRKCPVNAIYDQPQPRGDGGMQCMDHDTCRDYFDQNYTCAICLAICPFSQVGYDKVKERFKGNPNAPQFQIPVSAIQVTGS